MLIVAAARGQMVLGRGYAKHQGLVIGCKPVGDGYSLIFRALSI
jgi:hypothetical protein